MFNSTVLEVAIGLVFTFAAVSIMTSSVNEAIASVLKLRANSLLDEIKSLLNDKDFNGLALSLYNHALINPRSNGQATDSITLTSKPSYINAEHFASAMVDVVQTEPGNIKQLGADIDSITDPQIKQLLKGIYTRSSGSIDKFQAELATWFNNSMDRASGAYKRKSQIYCLIIGFMIAVLFNISVFQLFSALWNHPAYVSQINVVSKEQLATVQQQLYTLPVGWSGYVFSWSSLLTWNFWLMVFGWVITASSVLFGAPFWFDLLQQLVQLRGVGGKPKIS